MHESVLDETNKIKNACARDNLNILLKDTRNDWSIDLDALDKNVDRIVKETERIMENAYIGGRKVGRFHSFEPIHKTLREEEVSKIEGTIGVIIMLTYIQDWLKKNSSDVYLVFYEVIKGLMEDLGDIY